jgi:5-formyltetrahydrofolate cyclo-ligase
MTIQTDKAKLRQLATQKRNQVSNRLGQSQLILERFFEHFQPQAAQNVCCYVDKEPEVETQDFIKSCLAQRHCLIVVPYCDGDHLRLVRLTDWQQLELMRYGLLEPKANFRTPEQWVDPTIINYFLVPGLAFDTQGNRLGYGKGYYDGLLKHRSVVGRAIGLAFDSQIIPNVPTDPQWDQPMDYILTPQRLVDCKVENSLGNRPRTH